MTTATSAYRQFHNQPPGSPLDGWLRRLWADVAARTGGRLVVAVRPQNDGIAGGDPAAVRLLVDGELEFLATMGGLLGGVCPAAEIQGVPFAFRDHAHAFRAMDGALGDYLRQEFAAAGLHLLPRACLENGFRHISTRHRPIRTVDDLAGLRIRTPAGPMFQDFFTALGAAPVAINMNRLHAALADGTVEAQENPLVMIEANRLHELQTHVSLTGHMWSGFNMLANLAAWRSLPEDVRALVEQAAADVAALQRRQTDADNTALVSALAARGMIVNRADTSGFRAPLGAFYARWKRALGPRAWSLLEAEAGPLG